MQSRCKKHCRWNERLRFNHITTLRRRMQVSKSFCGNAKQIKINSVLKVCLESRAFSLFQISLRGYLKQSKISSISTNTAGFCVKKPWNPQRIPAALCLKSCLCLRNIRHFLCFQIHLSIRASKSYCHSPCSCCWQNCQKRSAVAGRSVLRLRER